MNDSRRRYVNVAFLLALVGGVYLVYKFQTDWSVHLPPAEAMTLYSLKLSDIDPTPVGSDWFHGHKILGQTDIASAEGRAELLTALERGIGGYRGAGAAKCFRPRHGIRAISGGETIDYVICFECSHLHILTAGKNEERLTGADPQPVFDRHLNAAGVNLGRRN